MRLVGAKEVKRLTKKLKSEGDITQKEAEKIVRPFCVYTAKIDEGSPSSDVDLIHALCDWYEEVLKKLPKYGNYVHSIPLFMRNKTYGRLAKTITKCIEALPLLDKAFEIRASKNFPIEMGELHLLRHFVHYADKAGEARELGIYDTMKQYVSVIEGDYAEYCCGLAMERSRYIERDVNSMLIYNSVLSCVIYDLGIPSAFIEFICPAEKKLFIPCHCIDLLDPILSRSPEDIVKEARSLGLLEKGHVSLLLSGHFIRDFKGFQGIIDNLSRIFTKRCLVIQDKNEIAYNDDWILMDR